MSSAQRSAEDFRLACQAYCAHHYSGAEAGDATLGPRAYSQGWAWKETARLYQTPIGYLWRVLELEESNEDGISQSDELDTGEASFLNAAHGIEEVPDAAEAQIAGSAREPRLRVEQSICYSTTWRVPVLYFNVMRGEAPHVMDRRSW